ncbi:hypothetical protein GCM10025880_16890 [Methylorubrum aminovorans]|nr:hypothetical protein GCM10025880_16890 [Methylorubrum aminovorans]
MASAARQEREPAAPQGASQISPSGESEKRRQILEGARQVFMASGFDGASMGEIAKAANVSKGTLYVYFDSKEALFEALTTEAKTGLAENLFRLDEDDPDVRAVLTRLGTSYLAMMARPEHVSIIRMVIGACEKFPGSGRPSTRPARPAASAGSRLISTRRSRPGASPPPTPTSPPSTSSSSARPGC